MKGERDFDPPPAARYAARGQGSRTPGRLRRAPIGVVHRFAGDGGGMPPAL